MKVTHARSLRLAGFILAAGVVSTAAFAAGPVRHPVLYTPAGHSADQPN